MSVTDGTSIQVNASDARKPQTRGNNYFQACGSSKPSRFWTYCNRKVDFCYQNNSYPNINKQQPRSNDISQGYSDASLLPPPSLNASASSNTSLSQEQYSQLVSLLQQENLVTSVYLPQTTLLPTISLLLHWFLLAFLLLTLLMQVYLFFSQKYSVVNRFRC